MKNFPKLGKILQTPTRMVDLVAELYRIVKILYTSDYVVEDPDWQWLIKTLLP
jgi:hypothetical protein